MPYRDLPSIPARVIGLCAAQRDLVVQPEGYAGKIVIGQLSPQTRLRALFAGSVNVVRNPISTDTFLFREVRQPEALRLGH